MSDRRRAGGAPGLPARERFADGSYRSELRWNRHGRSADRTPIPVRGIAYTRDGTLDAATTYRLVTSILEPPRAPAAERAALYQERWAIEMAFDAFTTQLRGAHRVHRVRRSKTPALVRQEAWGFLLAHFAIRALMHEAALGARPQARDPDRRSFPHAVCAIRGTLPQLATLSPSGPAARASGHPA